MLLTFTYSLNYDPAMPSIKVDLGLSRNNIQLTLKALVDSGADGTMIPIRHLRALGAKSREKRWMRGVAGGRYQVSLYPVFLQVGRLGMYLPVVGDTLNDEVIVGRDFLNHMIVTLNGLAETVEISI